MKSYIDFNTQKRQRALEEKLNCKSFKINKSNDFNYELGNIHSFID